MRSAGWFSGSSSAAAKLAGLAEDRVGDIALDGALQRRQRVEHEAHFFDGGGIGHGGVSRRGTGDLPGQILTLG